MKMKLFLISAFLFLFSFSVSSQDCVLKQELTFNSNEKLVYDVAYNWLFVWVDVARAYLEIEETKIKGKDCYHFIAHGKTKDKIDFFYAVDDLYESWVDPATMRPYYYKRDIDEDGYKLKIDYDYDWDSNIVYSESQVNRQPKKFDTVKVPPCTFDMVSILYKVRHYDYSKYKVGEKIPMTIMLDRELHDLYFRYLGVEKKKVKGIGTFSAMHFSVQVVAGEVFKEDSEDLHVWVSNDKNKIPIFVESPLLIGSVKVRITGLKNVKYPLTSLIKAD